MKKTVKKNLIAVCSLAFALSAGIGLNAVSASATTTEVAIEGNFEMGDGASIRIKSGAPSGIRWFATVTQDYYNYVTTLDANAKFGMLVDNAEIESEEVNDSEVVIECTATPTFDEDGVWTYNASITYDTLATRLEAENKSPEEIQDALQKCYKTELWARAYVEVNGVKYYAIEADVNRSIKGVATNCLVQEATVGNEDVTETNVSAFVDYAGANYTVKEEQAFNNANAYNTTSKSGTFTANLDNGDYDVYFGAKYLGKATASDGAISVTAEGFGKTKAIAGEMGKLSFINANSQVTTVPFISATHLISTADAFVAFQNEIKSQTITSSNPAYVVLTNDIDYADKTGSGSPDLGELASNAFYGTFDGLGHSVNNWGTTAAGGVFGALGSGSSPSVIKNVAFVNLTNARGVSTGNCGLLTGYTYGGAIENVYVKGTMNNTHNSFGVNSRGNIISISNSVFDITYPTDATYNVFPANHSLTNVLALGNAKQLTPSNSTAPYATESALVEAERENVKQENGWNSYWSVDEYGLNFGNNAVAQNKTTLETLYLDENTNNTINLSELTGGAVEKVLQNGVEIPENYYEGCALTCDVVNGGYTHGEENVISVYGNGKIVEQPFVVCTYVINDYEEFDVVMESFNAENHDSSGWYIVLGNDIDAKLDSTVVTGATRTNNLYMQSSGTRTFEGTFNGLGHTVANLNITGQGGIFGRLKDATVENVAFVGFYNGSNSGYVFNNYGHGTSYVKNVYLEGYSVNECVFRGGGVLYTSNVVMSVKYPEATKYAYDTDYTYSRATNCFAIGNFAGFHTTSGGTVSGTVYENTATFATEENLATITSANGWNMDIWSVKDGALYFGKRAVQDVTYETYGQVTLP